MALIPSYTKSFQHLNNYFLLNTFEDSSYFKNLIYDTKYCHFIQLPRVLQIYIFCKKNLFLFIEETSITRVK
jgi:hypothetical protein